MTAQIGQLVRALLSEDLESYADRTAALDDPGWNAFGEIVGAAFYRAIEERFGTAEDGDAELDEEQQAKESEQIAAFVAEAAEPYAGTAVAIDSPSAEALVRSVLGDDEGVTAVLDELEEPDLARIELVLLRALLADGSQDSVEDLVAGAEGEAAQFSGPQSTGTHSGAHLSTDSPS